MWRRRGWWRHAVEHAPRDARGGARGGAAGARPEPVERLRGQAGDGEHLRQARGHGRERQDRADARRRATRSPTTGWSTPSSCARACSSTTASPFDAEAVMFNLERYQEEDSVRSTEIEPVESVEAVDDSTVRVTLERPFAPFLAVLTDRAGIMVSPKASRRAAGASPRSRSAPGRSSSSSGCAGTTSPSRRTPTTGGTASPSSTRSSTTASTTRTSSTRTSRAASST